MAEILIKFEKILSSYNQFRIFKKKHLSFKRIFSAISFKSEQEKLNLFLKENEIIFSIKDDLLNFTKKNLTTEVLAKYTINKVK